MSFSCESLPLWLPNLRVSQVEIGVAIGVCVVCALGVQIGGLHRGVDRGMLIGGCALGGCALGVCA